MMPVQSTSRPQVEHSPEADAQVVLFPRNGEPQQQPHELLRELRLDRGWSMIRMVQAMRACATAEELKGLPGPDSLLQNWVRWEKGRVEPDRNRPKPFYKPIIARAFGITPDKIWSTEQVPQSRMPRFVQPVEYRDEMESRRRVVHEAICKLQKELAYLNEVLAIPVPVND